MKIISRRLRDRRLRVGLTITATVTFVLVAAVMGGIEWAFASLGMIVLIGMIGISIYTLAKIVWRSDKSLKGECPEHGSTSASAFDGDCLKNVTYSEPPEALPISKEDKRLIMKYVDEFFAKGLEQSREKPAEALPISEEDKRLIMKHVDDFFAKKLGQSEGKPSYLDS